MVRVETLSSFASSFLLMSCRCIVAPGSLAFGIVRCGVTFISTPWKNVRLGRKLPIHALLVGLTANHASRDSQFPRGQLYLSRFDAPWHRNRFRLAWFGLIRHPSPLEKVSD